MFYSQLLLSKKGALGIVWMAAHCHRKLKKDQVQQTNISSSVDKILGDEVPVVTHRILAFLLLGIVRIYSKKVEYLFHDCHEVLDKLCGPNTGKSTHTRIGVSRTRTHYHTVTLPKTFELDAFDLELLEDQNMAGKNVRLHEEDIIEDGSRKDCSTSGLVRHKEKVQNFGAYSTAYTPPREVFSCHQESPLNNMNISLSGLELLRGTGFSLGDRLDPFVLDEAEEEQMHNNLSNRDPRTSFDGQFNEMESDSVVSLSSDASQSVPSEEILRGAGISFEDRLDPMVLDEVEKEQNDSPSHGNIHIDPIQEVELNSAANPSPQGSNLAASSELLQQSGSSLEHTPSLQMLNEAEERQEQDEPSDMEHGVEEEHMEHLKTRLNFQEDESLDFTGPVMPVGAKKMKSLQVIITETEKSHGLDGFPMIVTPDSKFPAGHSTPEVVSVQTPATKERPRVLKRKTFFDLAPIIPNKVFKNWIEDSSQLRRERKEVPHTLLHSWRAHKLGNGPQSLFEPLILGISKELACLECKKSWESPVQLIKQYAGADDVRSPVEQNPEIRSPVTDKSTEQTPIAPGTPVTQSKPSRSYEAREVAGADILEPTTSFENTEKSPSSEEALQFDAVFHMETSSFEGDSNDNDSYSARTRMAGRYLNRMFTDKKRRKEEEVLNLSQLLRGKTRKESARLFYEILVLKTRVCIDVQQENAYDDIFLRQSSGNVYKR